MSNEQMIGGFGYDEYWGQKVPRFGQHLVTRVFAPEQLRSANFAYFGNVNVATLLSRLRGST